MCKLKVLSIIIIINLSIAGFSQQTTVGIINGINFSDINNTSVSGKWQSMTGPLAGIYLNYKINNFLAVNTEINYLSLYYQYKSYYNPYIFYTKPNLSSYITYPVPTLSNKIWNFSYLRFPVLLKFYTPTRLGFHFSVGGYLSKMISSNKYNYELQVDEYPNIDYGLMFASGISYSFQNKLNLNLELRYAGGKKQIISEDNRNGSLELSFGVGYTFLSKKKKEKFSLVSFPDTLNPKLSIKYAGGLNITQNFGENKEQYNVGLGFTGGLSLIYQSSKFFSIQTEILFQRNSYSLNDSSLSYFYYEPDSSYSFVDTKTDINYINIPILMNFFLDKKARFYLNVGLYTSIRMNVRVVGKAYNQTQTESQITHTTTYVYDNIEGEIKNTDWGWLAGAGYQLPLFKKFKLDIGLRYEASFINIYNKGDNNKSIKLRNINLMAGIIIPINPTWHLDP